VPAEAAWDENLPLIERLGHSQTFGLSSVRACAVCGYRLAPGEMIWRLFTQVEPAYRRMAKRDLCASKPGTYLHAPHRRYVRFGGSVTGGVLTRAAGLGSAGSGRASAPWLA
jgi:hypothetical protein